MKLIPTITQLFNGTVASLNAQFGITIPTTGKNFLRDLANVWGNKLKTAYLYLGDVQKNTWYTTATPPSQGGKLYDFGMSFLRRTPYAATQNQYNTHVIGDLGATIAANTTFLSDPDSLSPGYLFILDNDYTITGSLLPMLLRCTTPGTKTNLDIGNTLTCTKPLVNINQTVTVNTIEESAIDGETDEQYRDAIDQHVTLAAQGGAFADYRIWGRPVGGVQQIYPYTASGAVWQVNVYVEAILSDSGGVAPDYGYGVPTATILDNVTAAILTNPITGNGRKPAGVVLGPSNVGALPVAVQQVEITFTGSTGISVDQQAAITTALQQAISKIRPFIAGADILIKQNDTISVGLPASGGRVAPPEKYVIVVIAMAAAPGAVFTGCSMTVGGVGVDTYTFDQGEIPYLQATNVTFS